MGFSCSMVTPYSITLHHFHPSGTNDQCNFLLAHKQTMQSTEVRLKILQCQVWLHCKWNFQFLTETLCRHIFCGLHLAEEGGHVKEIKPNEKCDIVENLWVSVDGIEKSLVWGTVRYMVCVHLLLLVENGENAGDGEKAGDKSAMCGFIWARYQVV